jgi:beta-galactosidase
MADFADFKGTRRKVFHGFCLAIVQSNARPGQIRIATSSPGLKTAALTITTRA